MKATLVFLFGLLLVGAVIAQAQQPSPPQASATDYSWHGELVAFDANTRTITARTAVVGESPVNEIKSFKAGDRVLLFWSGFDASANGVRGVMKYDAAQASREPFMLPAELVTPTIENNYVTIKLRTPAAADAVVKGLKPGEWMTVTSKHRPSAEADGVVAIKPYVTAGDTGTN